MYKVYDPINGTYVSGIEFDTQKSALEWVFGEELHIDEETPEWTIENLGDITDSLDIREVGAPHNYSYLY